MSSSPRFSVRFLFTADGWPYLLVPFIPLALVLDLGDAAAGLIFFAAAAGIIPTAALMGRATEELAAKSGPGIGGLLNVTFGNAPELIIALFALEKGLHEVVKASIIGSILGNALLVLGGSMLVGGLVKGGRKFQSFDSTTASTQVSMLFLAVAALLMPAIFELVDGRGLPDVGIERFVGDTTIENLSLGVAVVLLLTYACGLLFSLRTHADLFNPVEGEGDAGHEGLWDWTVRRSVTMLAIAGVAVGIMSEVLVGSISEASEAIGLSEFFIGVIVVAIVGNAAEHWVAILVASKNQMNLAVNIAIGSAGQIALAVAPVLVIASFFIGPGPMPLVFNGFEIGAVMVAVIATFVVSYEGRSTWFAGAQLLALYMIFVITFFAA